MPRNRTRGRTPRLSPQQEIAQLNKRIESETPDRGTIPHGKNSVVAFASMPMSQATLQGLERNAYHTMTTIQSSAIPHALAGRDILGAAKTGSGKTLAFLIPMLESLFRQSWTPQDGVGAIVLSPTRELAGQIFAVLRKIGKYHKFTVGLLMGGRHKQRREIGNNDFVKEQQSIPTTNILICTPGRLLQHLEQTPYFQVDALQMLVLDEADRILDMGFRPQLLRILDYLPTERQTLLFSATQTKDVKHLATLSINRKTVEYLGVHDEDEAPTPDRLKQAYVVVPIEHKLNCVYSFLKTHLRHKTIVFLASCSQVRHAWDLFCRLRPGLSVLAMHGKLSQPKRLQVYDKFTTTPHAVMFATDVASRGLDFPNVDWVLQVDAPEDPEMYIHRVGRTARFQQKGQALLLLDPHEEASVKGWPLKAPLQKKSINPTKTMLVSQRAASLVAEHSTLHLLAKKAFLSYVRSLALLPKTAWGGDFNMRRLHWEAYASSLGLAAMPNLDFLDKIASREGLRETKNVNRKLQKLKEQIKAEKEKKRQAKSKKRPRDDENDEEKEKEEDWLVVKARHEPSKKEEDEEVPLGSTEPRHPKRIRIDGSNSAGGQHTKFEDDGTEQPKLLQPTKGRRDDLCRDDSSDEEVDAEALQEANDSYMDQVRRRLAQNKDLDKQEERERIRAKHKKKRMQEKLDLDEDSDAEGHRGGAQAVLAPNMEGVGPDKSASSDDSSSSDDGSDSSSSSSDDEEDIDVAAQEDLALSLIRGKA